MTSSANSGMALLRASCPLTFNPQGWRAFAGPFLSLCLRVTRSLGYRVPGYTLSVCCGGQPAAVTCHHSCGHQLPNALRRSSRRLSGYGVRTLVREVCISAPNPPAFSRTLSHIDTSKSSLQPLVSSWTWLLFLSGILVPPRLTRRKKNSQCRIASIRSSCPLGWVWGWEPLFHVLTM